MREVYSAVNSAMVTAWHRIIDDSGEDYLYPRNLFIEDGDEEVEVTEEQRI